MRKIVLIALISIFLFISLTFFLSQPSVAQEPDDPPAKGSEPTPGAPAPEPTPAPPPLQIDQTLLPKIEPQLLKRLLTSAGEPAPFIVYLKAKADLEAAVTSASAGIDAQAEPDSLTKRTAIINTLQQTARDTQSGVLQVLNTPPPGGDLSGQSVAATDVKPLWIVNAVAAKGSLEMVLALAARPDVEIVRLDKEIKINQPPPILDFGFSISDCQQTDCPIQNQKSAIQNPEWGVSKIRADLVHTALGIDGTGVVVANIDTGVDWQHPALQANYRGYMGAGKLPLHSGNWFDATDEGAIYPVDGYGHGTHTMGTIAGSGGIGVAPGARWIAVRAFDSSGGAQSSWLHSAFQWVLAPDENPALAPYIVNNSWGSDAGYSTEFEADVQALLDAGIYPVFSAGNAGPWSGTVGSPASYDIAFSVGATTIDDEIADFSSRGPSPWGQIKPEVSAPGKNVRSALPGGTYGNKNGTSMAAPHASGLAALLLQASPTLSNNLGSISNIMKSTAVDLGSPGPDNNYGWGRIDAYNAVMSVASVGALQGVVTDATTSAAISGPLIQITPDLGGPTINTIGDVNGAYTQGLAPNTYDVTASAFGYLSTPVKLIEITTNTTKIQNFSLTPQPTGFLTGTVKDKNTGNPLAATIAIDNTPVSTTTNPADGSYSLELPVGVYTVTVIAAEHRITRAVNINITTGVTTTRDFLLESAPSILVVDSGKWYQESQIGYYQQALYDALYPYDTWQITKPFDTPNDVPPATTLSNYDIVIWSSPLDSPGYIGADDELETFLAGGGKLLLSGQDVAYYDDYWLWYVSYLRDMLKVDYVQDNSGSDTVTGIGGEPFAGLSLSIAGGDGANNQTDPDIIANAGSDFAGPLLSYNSDNLAGLHVDLCVPYRAIFFAFGFEGINSQADRSQVMAQIIDWLMQAPDQAGVELTPAQETLIGNFGTTVTHTVRLRNTGANTDVFTLTLSNIGPYTWSTSAVPPSQSLATCQSQDITVTVQVPTTKTWHISDTFTLFAQSNNSITMTDIATRSTKTPAPVLLVDDDRWYSFAEEYQEALAANNIPYDYWLVPKSWSGPVPPSPPLETLQMYPMIVWYTAYDWYQPLTPTEEDRLADYLDGGGRLLFSSQDYIYRHLVQHGSYATFAQNYLGIQAHTEDYTSTLITGQAENPVGAYLGPYALTFPLGYRNWTDAVTATATAQVATLGQENQPNGLINAGVGPGGDHWHTTFLAYGPELMSLSNRTRLMQRSLGWLSWLGSSTIDPQITSAVNGGFITYTATITNNGWDPISTAYFTATFPGYLTPISASPEVISASGEFRWSDSLTQNQSKTFTYMVRIDTSPLLGTVISQTSWLAYAEHNILFDRITDLSVAPEFLTSKMIVTPTKDVEENDVLTYIITLTNSGTIDAPVLTTTDTLPQMLNLMPIDSPSNGTVISNGGHITWTATLPQGEVATLTFQAIVTPASGGTIENIAYVQDDINEVILLSASATFKTIPTYLPIILKKQ